MGKSAINPAVVGKHSTDIAALKNDLGIVEDGDTATHTIAQGQYVIWQGALYTADAAIASGTTLAASGGNKNLTVVENGGLNALNGKLEAEISLPSGYGVSHNNKVYKVGKVVQFSVSLTIPAWTTKTLSINGLIPSGFTPRIETNFAGIDNTNDLAISCFITSGGNLSIYRNHTTSCTSLRLGVTYLT